ncbi:MAG: hypothetical protein U0736_12745 [Gemmataceae bacterium]
MTASTREGRPDPSTGEAAPRQVIGRFVQPATDDRNGHAEAGMRPVVAVFCYDGPDSYIGGHVRQLVAALATVGGRFTCSRASRLPSTTRRCA